MQGTVVEFGQVLVGVPVRADRAESRELGDEIGVTFRVLAQHEVGGRSLEAERLERDAVVVAFHVEREQDRDTCVEPGTPAEQRDGDPMAQPGTRTPH